MDEERERGFHPPETDKEIVVYRGGWGFHLPAQHTVHVSEERREALISNPQRGAAYRFDRIQETDEEFRIYVSGGSLHGHALGDLPAEYPFPTIDVELDRLRADWDRLGGKRQEFEAWQQRDELGRDESYDSKTSRLRAAIRRMKREQATEA